MMQEQNIVGVLWFAPFLLAAAAFLVSYQLPSAVLPLLIVSTALNRFRFDLMGAGLRLEHFVFVAAVLGWWLRVRPGWRDWRFTRADFLLAAYLALVGAVSWQRAPDLAESVQFLGLMAFGVALYWVVRALASDSAAFTRGVWALVIVGVVVGLYGIAAWLLYPMGLNLGVQVYALDSFWTFSPYGTLFDSNTFGIFLMAVGVILAVLLLEPQFAARWLVLGAGVGVALVGMALSLTRGAWAGLAAALTLVWLASPRRWWAAAIGGAAVAVVVLALLFNSAWAARGTDASSLAGLGLERLMTSRSIEFRLDAYERALRDWLASPLVGWGANTFGQKYRAPQGGPDWISNLVLMTLHDTGLIGLALLGSWLVWLGRDTVRTLLRSPASSTRSLLLALALAYAALLVAFQTTTLFWLGMNWVFLGLIAGGTLELSTPNPSERFDHSRGENDKGKRN